MQAIVAVSQSWGIGRDGQLLFRIRADLQRFKALTTGHPVILGRKTLATFPGGRPLKGRRNLILSRNPDFTPEGAEVFADLGALCAAAPEDSFVIGGESVYRSLLARCDTAYVTKIDAAWPADAFFPNLDEDPEWEISAEEPLLDHEGLFFRYVTYRRK